MFVVRDYSAADATSNGSLFKLSNMAFCLASPIGGLLVKRNTMAHAIRPTKLNGSREERF